MTHEQDDEIVQVAFKAPQRMADAIHRAAARRLLSKSSYIRTATLQALEDDGISLAEPAGGM